MRLDESEKFRHGLRPQQLGRIRRNRSGGEDRQVVHGQQHVVEVGSAGQHIGQAQLVVQAQPGAHLRAAQIRINQQDPGAGLGQNLGQIRRGLGLALTLHGRRDDDGGTSFTAESDEAHGGAQLPIRLVAGPGCASGGSGFVLGPVRPLVMDHGGQDRRIGDFLEVIPCTDTRVKQAPHQRLAQTEDDAGDQSQGDVHHGTR